MIGNQERSSFARIYKATRRSARIRQSFIARTCGLTQPAVSQWEKGGSEPSLANLCKVADILCVSTDYLLGMPKAVGVSKRVARADAEIARLTRECERLSRECERLASRNEGR